jgi:c-di-GMP-binding flagellar brake protein YcgR
VQLPKDEKYLFKFINKNGVYRFTATVKKHRSDGIFQFTEIELLGDGVRIQQREHFRCSCTIPFIFAVKMEDKPESQFSEEKQHGIIRDLSGGGMRIAAKHNLEIKDLIQFNLHLGDIILELTGEIKSKSHNSHASLPYMYGITFRELTEVTREKIIFFVHSLQRKAIELAANG